ncbi:MAG: sulfotransferase [Campylobacterota bacterium]|nr:sulfotransferase [Campylobacterota bacterium]
MNMIYKLIERYGLIRHIYNYIKYFQNKIIKYDPDDEKVFVIGLNKTGTTSLKIILKDFGYSLGIQEDAELINYPTLNGEYKYLYEYMKSADAFQDVPFSFRNIYKVIHKRYPKSKFILTVRDNTDVWYSSLVNFTNKRFIMDGEQIKNEILLKDIKKLKYRYPNMPYINTKLVWHGDKHVIFDDDDAFDEDYCKYYYNKHIKEAKEYFKDSENFLILNIEEKDAYNKLCSFLGKKPLHDDMPHENKT